MFSKNNFKYIQKLQKLLKNQETSERVRQTYTTSPIYDAGQLPKEGPLTSRARAACNWSLYAFL